MDCVRLKHIFLEGNLLCGNSNSGSVLSTVGNATGLCRVAGEICSFLEKKFLGRGKKKNVKKKANLPPWKSALKEMQVLPRRSSCQEKYFPRVPWEERGKGGDSGVRDPRVGKKSRGWWQKDLNSCTMCLSDVFTFNLQVKFKQQPKPTDQHIFSTKLK